MERNDLVVILGAGASVDAGIPASESMVRAIVSEVSTMEEKLLNQILEYDPECGRDVEWLYASLRFLSRKEQEPAGRLLELKPGLSLNGVKALRHRAEVIIDRLLSRPVVEKAEWSAADYLAGLAEMCSGLDLPCLKIFTLNYDLSLEYAFKRKGIKYSTGFNTTEKTHGRHTGNYDAFIQIFKLHGSHAWRLIGPAVPSSHERSRAEIYLVELSLSEYRNEQRAASESDVHKRWSWISPYGNVPPMIVADVNKARVFEPYLSMHNAFHQSMESAKSVLCIGFSWRDEYIVNLLDNLANRPIVEMPWLIDLSVDPGWGSFDVVDQRKLVLIKGTAREALTRSTLGYRLSRIGLKYQTGTLETILRDLLLEPDPDKLFGKWHRRCRRCGASIVPPLSEEDSHFQETVGPLCEECRIKLGVY